MTNKNNPFYKNRLHHYYLVSENLSRLKSNHSEKWLDAGCGFGEFIGKLSHNVSGNQFYGYDVDPEKIVFSRNKYNSVNFSLGKVGTKLPYKNNFFDKIFLFHVLEHVDSEEEIINEIARILKKGGVLYLASPYKGMFAWADAANLRYQIPYIHRILAKLYYGNKRYDQLFRKNKDHNLLGDSSLNRDWHKHYKEFEIKNLLSNKFKINKFVKFSLFHPFLLDLGNLWKFIFKNEGKLIDELIYFDNRLQVGDYSYNMLVVAIKK